MSRSVSSRRFSRGVAVGCALPTSIASAQEVPPAKITRRNISSFRTHRCQDHLDDVSGGGILSDRRSRMLQYRSEDGRVSKVYPTGVPLTDGLARLGFARVVRKVEGRSWRPTPSMTARNPEWPDSVGPGPENPLGSHAKLI